MKKILLTVIIIIMAQATFAQRAHYSTAKAWQYSKAQGDKIEKRVGTALVIGGLLGGLVFKSPAVKGYSYAATGMGIVVKAHARRRK